MNPGNRKQDKQNNKNEHSIYLKLHTFSSIHSLAVEIYDLGLLHFFSRKSALLSYLLRVHNFIKLYTARKSRSVVLLINRFIKIIL